MNRLHARCWYGGPPEWRLVTVAWALPRGLKPASRMTFRRLLVLEFGSLEEVIVASGTQRHVAYTPVADQDIVVVPEVDRRQILGEDLLNLGIELLALVLVELHACLID